MYVHSDSDTDMSFNTGLFAVIKKKQLKVHMSI